MINLILRKLSASDEKPFLNFLLEWVGESPHWASFTWKDGMSFSEMLNILEKEHHGIDLLPNRVPHTMLYAFVNNEIVGRLSVRHKLNKELSFRGGHIGYAVAKKFRQNGYAKEIVRQGLDFCRSLQLKSIMITCADENIPSWKVIEAFNGILQDKVWDDEDNEMIRRYWITL